MMLTAIARSRGKKVCVKAERACAALKRDVVMEPTYRHITTIPSPETWGTLSQPLELAPPSACTVPQAITYCMDASVKHGHRRHAVDLRQHAVKWNTRQESNLRALGSKPNGDAGNPRLVYWWIRRQESDLRGLRSER